MMISPGWAVTAVASKLRVWLKARLVRTKFTLLPATEPTITCAWAFTVPVLSAVVWAVLVRVCANGLFIMARNVTVRVCPGVRLPKKAPPLNMFPDTEESDWKKPAYIRPEGKVSNSRTLFAVIVPEVLRRVRRNSTVSLLTALVEPEKELLLERFRTSLVRLSEGAPPGTQLFVRLTETVAVSDTEEVLVAAAWAVLTRVVSPQIKLDSSARFPVKSTVWVEPTLILPRLVTVLPEIRLKLFGRVSVTTTFCAVAEPVEVT